MSNLDHIDLATLALTTSRRYLDTEAACARAACLSSHPGSLDGALLMPLHALRVRLDAIRSAMLLVGLTDRGGKVVWDDARLREEYCRVSEWADHLTKLIGASVQWMDRNAN